MLLLLMPLLLVLPLRTDIKGNYFGLLPQMERNTEHDANNTAEGCHSRGETLQHQKDV